MNYTIINGNDDDEFNTYQVDLGNGQYMYLYGVIDEDFEDVFTWQIVQDDIVKVNYYIKDSSHPVSIIMSVYEQGKYKHFVYDLNNNFKGTIETHYSGVYDDRVY